VSKKITELSTEEPDNLAFFTFVMTADNFKCTLPMMLYSETGDEKKFGANGGSLTFDAQGYAILDVPDGQGLIVRRNGVDLLVLDDTGSIIDASPSGLFRVNTANPAVRLIVSESSPQAQLLCDGESAEVSYVPIDDANWDGTPSVVHDALDELAARLRSLGG
jgi:hypothetical protein